MNSLEHCFHLQIIMPSLQVLGDNHCDKVARLLPGSLIGEVWQRASRLF